jgi:hypothetical protein
MALITRDDIALDVVGHAVPVGADPVGRGSVEQLDPVAIADRLRAGDIGTDEVARHDVRRSSDDGNAIGAIPRDEVALVRVVQPVAVGADPVQ